MTAITPKVIIETLFRRPLLNLQLQYSLVPAQITAVKSFLFTRSLQSGGAEPRHSHMFFTFLTFAFILPYLPYHEIWKPVLNFGIIFTFSYVKTLTILHGRNIFVLYDLIVFLASISCVEFESIIDFYIILVTLYELYALVPISEYGMTIVQVVFSCVSFMVLWWSIYLFTIFYLLTKLMRAHDEFCPRLFCNSLVFILFYRMLGLRQVYI